ncbi:hypothetical protein Tco_0366767 [Tanacetum coccineum]
MLSLKPPSASSVNVTTNSINKEGLQQRQLLPKDNPLHRKLQLLSMQGETMRKLPQHIALCNTDRHLFSFMMTQEAEVTTGKWKKVKRIVPIEDSNSKAMVAKDSKMVLEFLTRARSVIMHQLLSALKATSSKRFFYTDGYQLSLESLEVIIRTHEKNEYAWGDKYEQMEYDLKIRDWKLDWVNSDDEEVPLGVSEIRKQTVLKSETSSENKSPRNKDSFGQRSRRRGLGCRDGSRVNHRNFSSDYTYPHQRRSFIPSAVLTREGLKSIVRSKMTQAVPSQSTASAFYQNTARPKVSKAVLSQITARPYFPRPVFRTSTGRPYYPRMDNGNPEEELKDHAIIDSGCSRRGKITGKGNPSDISIDFENVRYNLRLLMKLLGFSELLEGMMINQKGKGPDRMFDRDILNSFTELNSIGKKISCDTAVKQSNLVDFEDVDDQQFIVHGSSSFGNKAVSGAITNDAQNKDSDESTIDKEVPFTIEDQDL